MSVNKSIVIQKERLAKLLKAESNYKKSPKDRITRGYIETRLENVDALWKEFNQEHYNIYGSATTEEIKTQEYFVKGIYDIFEETYTHYKGCLREALRGTGDVFEEAQGSMESQSVVEKHRSNEVKLPKIELPKFCGKYEDWQQYFDLFTSLIHKNRSLSAVEKLHYLKSTLSGEAEVLIRNLPTTDLNYDAAWKKLIARYNNKRYNLNIILKNLFSQKQITSESAHAIRSLLDTTTSCITSINNLGIETKQWDVILIFLVVSKLDNESLRQWEVNTSGIASDALPSWSDLVLFLESRFRTLEMIDSGKQISKAPQYKRTEKVKSFASVHDNITKHQCTMCSGDHFLYQCKSFGQLIPRERQEFVQTKSLCYNCLSPTHSVYKCRYTTSCRRCGRRHHSLLHQEKEKQQELTNKSENNHAHTQSQRQNQADIQHSSPNHGVNVVANFAKEETVIGSADVLLATAIVKAYSFNGKYCLLRALIDQGSQASFVTEETVQTLGLKRIPVSGCVSGVGDGRLHIRHMVSFRIESRRDPSKCIQISAYVLRSLISRLPSSKPSSPDWSEIENLSLADPGFISPGRIDVLLGAEVYGDIILNDIIKHPEGHLLAQNTIFGWIISGKVPQGAPTDVTKMVSLNIQVKEDFLLKQFWELENEPNSIQKKFSKMEEKCEEFFDLTTTRNKEGRFVVRLPFNSDDPECQYGGLKEIAQKRFYHLEKKLQKNPKLKEEYGKVMQEYQDLGHMKEIKDEAIHPKAVYFPHHAVVREDRETTKLRVVFDASCKGANGVSLNDNLLMGPKLQQDLRHILMRWRRFPICIVADIVKMYRQVRIHDDDTRFQRILWRFNPDEPLGQFELLTLTFGTACAPHLVVKSLQRLADDEQLNFPTASEVTKRDFYVDDLMTCCETEEEAIQIYTEMNKLMEAGGFQLQKWSSNNKVLLQFIGQDNQKTAPSIYIKADNMVKVLGICWNRDSDEFQYTVELHEVNKSPTKRQVLSDIARIYDPMGWIAPVVLTAKVFIQKLWKSGLSWDDELPEDLLHEWLKYRAELSELKTIFIPRWLNFNQGCEVELHAFADASQMAYAGVVYFRTINSNGEIHVHLLTSKTKVAPIEKQLSIPRLELCGAVLAAKLLNEVAQVMNVPKHRLYAWTDSTVVLAWLRGLPSRWTTFVSNRVSEILNIIESSQFNHVGTKFNPADCASRGLQPSDLKREKLWWSGPIFLYERNITFSKLDYTTQEETRASKSQKIKTLVALKKEDENQHLIEEEKNFFWSKYSSLKKMLRIVSYVRRIFSFRLQNIEREKYPDYITAKEMNDSLLSCVKRVQHLWFKEEIAQLMSGGYVPKKNSMHALNPFLDEMGLLRVGGRINLSHLSYDEQHPLIMPEMSLLTQVIVEDAHSSTMHGGPQAMLNYIRSKFWIIHARILLKKLFRRCVTCIRYSQRKVTPLMGQLPEVRLKPNKVFMSSGVDYAGPINLRFSPGRGAKSYKGYVCLFVCMVTRAIHIEVVSDLTSKGFIAAFRRFVGRRGRCTDLHCDNGTNFVGADKELREIFNATKSKIPQEIAELLAMEGTKFHYIPPLSPNFGGLWEAGVRSVKTHLKKVIGDRTLTYEEMCTVLVQIESCLNSRPLTQLSEHSVDPLPLTPGHFLVGEPLINVCDNNFANQTENVNLTSRWKLVLKIANDFWHRWSKDYLLNLDKRYKWTTKKSEPDVGDIVIVREDNLPPTKWILGRIIETHPGKDNITRVITIKCKDKLLKRPINKLCLLPK
ncbi:uncharacterized protein LOC132903428 [Amyelois transitella]|uniref:uncharacterized protein LOC132903428 n=1 Tax=Amyelois transitella TaxID=680683 RepID=UPI00298F6636|nr:uncharacterized protein LOC132903428 [Amyelois transitella]